MPTETLEDQPVVIAENVELGYGRTPVLSGVQLEVRQGDFWCFIGPNGEGKTTLIKALLGAVKPRKGQIALRSDFIKRTRIGFVPQETEINPAVSTTVQEFILGGMIGVPVDGATRKLRLDQSMKLMEIQRFRERRIWELSGGQRQRVLIARALVRDPLMMIVDEPTAGLDFAAAAGLLETITQLNRQKGITVVFVTHDLDIGANKSSHVALFRGGRVQAGPTREVFNSENLSETFGAPMDVRWREDGTASVHSKVEPAEQTGRIRETFLEESIQGVESGVGAKVSQEPVSQPAKPIRAEESSAQTVEASGKDFSKSQSQPDSSATSSSVRSRRIDSLNDLVVQPLEQAGEIDEDLEADSSAGPEQNSEAVTEAAKTVSAQTQNSKTTSKKTRSSTSKTTGKKTGTTRKSTTAKKVGATGSRKSTTNKSATGTRAKAAGSVKKTSSSTKAARSTKSKKSVGDRKASTAVRGAKKSASARTTPSKNKKKNA